MRPNQGLLQPGGTETVQILLVEKDKNQLLAAYQSLGAAALDHCKDKFLVQSVAVTPAQAAGPLQEYDALTALWASTPAAVANKKLHVRHTVTGGDNNNVGAHAAQARNVEPDVGVGTASTALADMSKEQLIADNTNVRKKYDELVAFSVNLTAERDMLSNTLEQTKRDLNREIAKSGRGAATPAAAAAKQAKSGTSLPTLIVLLLLAMLLGAKLQQKTGLLQTGSVPFGFDVVGGGGDHNEAAGEL